MSIRNSIMQGDGNFYVKVVKKPLAFVEFVADLW